MIDLIHFVFIYSVFTVFKLAFSHSPSLVIFFSFLIWSLRFSCSFLSGLPRIFTLIFHLVWQPSRTEENRSVGRVLFGRFSCAFPSFFSHTHRHVKNSMSLKATELKSQRSKWKVKENINRAAVNANRRDRIAGNETRSREIGKSGNPQDPCNLPAAALD